MLSTLILLYALDTGNIPTACYVAAWVGTILQVIIATIKAIYKASQSGKE